MSALVRDDLWSLEQYSEQRPAFREKVLSEKKDRKIAVGQHIQLIFENRLTIQYQIQEMLRIEKTFEAAAIQEELDAYNPLLPDGENWKCTLFIQYTDVDERVERLKALVGIETKIWLKIGDTDKILPIADEDMDRSDEHKTSAVHFLRYPLNQAQIAAAKSGEAICVGVDHAEYPMEDSIVAETIRSALVDDLNS